jgi:hypothetical protein
MTARTSLRVDRGDRPADELDLARGDRGGPVSRPASDRRGA